MKCPKCGSEQILSWVPFLVQFKQITPDKWDETGDIQRDSECTAILYQCETCGHQWDSESDEMGVGS